MSTKHTPGPWRVHKYADIVAPDGEHLASAYTTSVGDAVRANARLIAAAPDLLAALNALVHATDTIHPANVNLKLYSAYQIAVAAIAKAEGKDS